MADAAKATIPLTGVDSGVAVIFTTWNPSDKNANVALSNGNLTATFSAGAGNNGVRATDSKAGGKHYFKVTATTVTTDTEIGIANALWNKTILLGLGSGESLAYRADGSVIYNAAVTGTAAAFASGAVLELCVDLNALLVWVRQNAGNWNNNVAADPATGVGGFSFAGFTGVAFPALSASGSVNVLTADFAVASPIPSFPNWNV